MIKFTDKQAGLWNLQNLQLCLFGDRPTSRITRLTGVCLSPRPSVRLSHVGFELENVQRTETAANAHRGRSA